MRSTPEQLISGLLNGDLDRVEAERLSAMLLEKRSIRKLYYQQAVAHALLRWRHGRVSPWSPGDIDPTVIAELLQEAEQVAAREAAEEAQRREREVIAAAARRREFERLQRRHVRRPQPIEIPYSVVYLGAAALAVSVMWLAITVTQVHDSRGADNVPADVRDNPLAAPPIATIIDRIDAELYSVLGGASEGEERTFAPVFGPSIAPGTYNLRRGVVELLFDNQVRLVVESPATVGLVSSNRVDLVDGRVVGDVPPSAIGFTIGTPTTTVVDLGTEFGVTVGESRAADVTVFDGEVEVVRSKRAMAVADNSDGPPSTIRRRLAANESVRVETSGSLVEAATAAALYFRKVPSLQELREKQAYERWLNHSERLAADPDVVAYYPFDGQQPGDGVLRNRAISGEALDGNIVGAKWEQGRWPYKQSLRFASGDPIDNPNNYVAVDIPGRFDELTLAAWVNIESQSAIHSGFTGLLMADEWNRVGEVHWQFEQSGSMHCGLFGTPESEAISSDAPLYAGQYGTWLHVAIVCRSQPGSVTMYVDGGVIAEIETRVPEQLVIGAARMGGWLPATEAGKVDEYRTLHGRIDELVVINRALDHSEVAELCASGRP